MALFDEQPARGHGDRRAFLLGLAGTLAVVGAAGGGVTYWLHRRAEQRQAALDRAALAAAPPVPIAEFDDAGHALGVHLLPVVRHTDAQWRQRLSPSSYNVLRLSETELPFSGDYDRNFRPGLYRCLGCGTALFSWEAKFKDPSGWPAFSAPIAPQNIGTGVDKSFGMNRTEVHCARCAGHLGFLFHDGPEASHLRYSINSVALRFVPAR